LLLHGKLRLASRQVAAYYQLQHTLQLAAYYHALQLAATNTTSQTVAAYYHALQLAATNTTSQTVAAYYHALQLAATNTSSQTVAAYYHALQLVPVFMFYKLRLTITRHCLQAHGPFTR